MKILTNITTDKKDVVKAAVATMGFKDMIGEPIKMMGVVVYEKDEPNEKTGEVETKTVTAIKLENGEFITSISPTVNNSLDMIIEMYEDEILTTGVDIIIKSKTSNSGRDFLYLDMI